MSFVCSATNVRVDPQLLPRAGAAPERLSDTDYLEVPIVGTHKAEVAHLPEVHSASVDRILIAQARVEGVPFIAADKRLGAYGHPVQIV